MNSVRQTLNSPRHIENTKTKIKSSPLKGGLPSTKRDGKRSIKHRQFSFSLCDGSLDKGTHERQTLISLCGLAFPAP